ncbi:hypothetical protein M9H77_26884 [Catharanthus roseus]|uniref:Uncharacterized protein n=1 Tax=Catharanthus roseus TaxID=4058 RepID=A0ACC0ABF3_CATRO|nr:hypothetical protein M9H77_26884 [Catharanthus roseus]
MEERGKIISNPPKCFKYNGVGHYASSCPTKRALIFREDLNGWIEKEKDESNECVEDQALSKDASKKADFERFPQQRKSKLDDRGDGPFQILEKINDNAYKVDLPGHYNKKSLRRLVESSKSFKVDHKKKILHASYYTLVEN